MTAKPPSLVTRKRIQVAGVVRGVGFRPFVYNLAQDLGLAGYALNSSAGVTIELEGDQAEIQTFLHTLEHQPPPLARIARIVVSEIEPNGELQFSIRKSLSVEGEFSLIPADVGTCEDCWRDFTDPNNRRFGYAFTNCTNCGPRYTIVQDVPYDRQPRRCLRFGCARSARQSTRILGTAAFMPSRTLVLFVARSLFLQSPEQQPRNEFLI